MSTPDVAELTTPAQRLAAAIDLADGASKAAAAARLALIGLPLEDPTPPPLAASVAREALLSALSKEAQGWERRQDAIRADPDGEHNITQERVEGILHGLAIASRFVERGGA